MFMPSTEACPWEGPIPGRLSLGTWLWTSFYSSSQGSQKLESDLDLLLQVLVVSFYSAVGQLWGLRLTRNQLPPSLLRPGLHILIWKPLSKQPALGWVRRVA